MIRSIFILFFLFLSSVLFGLDKDIVYYYTNNMKVFLTYGLYFPLTERGNVYYVQTYSGQELKPTVDIANGYMKIDDPDYGGQKLTVEYLLFKNSTNVDFIGMNVIRDDLEKESYSFKLYRPGENLSDVTSDLLPEIDFKLFFNQKFVKDNPRIIDSNKDSLKAGVAYHLSKTGLVINCELKINEYYDMIIKNRLEKASKLKEYKELENNIQYKNFDFVWDKKEGKFFLKNIH